MIGTFLATFCTLSWKIFNRGVQSKSSRESVSDSKCELKVFAILMFWANCQRFHPKQILNYQSGVGKVRFKSSSKKDLNLKKDLNFQNAPA